MSIFALGNLFTKPVFMNFKHTISILTALVVLASCSEINQQPTGTKVTTDELPSTMYVDDVCVNIIPGAALQTKSADAIYYTLVGEDGVTTYSLMVESEVTPEGLLSCRHYSETGEYIATFVYLDNELVNIEVDGAFVETKAFLEGYRDCVKATYRALRDQLQDDMMRTCDLGLGVCDATSAVVSVVKCTSAKNRE